MSRKIDPNDDKYKGGSGERTAQCGEGEKLLAGVGFERYTSSTGKRSMSMRFVCLADYAKLGDERHEVFENFTLEDSSMWRFANFAKAIGWSEPFDVDDDEDVQKVMASGYVRGLLVNERWNGKDRIKVKLFDACGEVEEDPEWEDWIAAGEEHHEKYMEWRQSNPRGSGGGPRSSSGGGGGSRSSGASDDIPF